MVDVEEYETHACTGIAVVVGLYPIEIQASRRGRTKCCLVLVVYAAWSVLVRSALLSYNIHLFLLRGYLSLTPHLIRSSKPRVLPGITFSVPL